jgi:polysaccharide pyruvyl transferase WcaK-like protein
VGPPQILNEVVGRLAQHLLDEGWQVEFWPMHPSDLRLGQQLIQDYHLKDVSLWTEFRNIGRTMERIHAYDLVIGQRLHAVVLACGSGVPAISLAYRPKCYDFMESIDMEPFAIRTDVVDLDKIIALIEQINTHYVDHCRRLNAACDRFRLQQRQAAADVLDLLNFNVNKTSTPLNPSQPWPEKYGERSV